MPTRTEILAVSMDEPLDLSLLNDIELGNFYGDESEKEQARISKQEAISVMAQYTVFEDTPIDEAGDLELIRARWERQQRGDEVKWRYVAQQFAWMD